MTLGIINAIALGARRLEVVVCYGQVQRRRFRDLFSPRLSSRLRVLTGQFAAILQCLPFSLGCSGGKGSKADNLPFRMSGCSRDDQAGVPYVQHDWVVTGLALQVNAPVSIHPNSIATEATEITGASNAHAEAIASAP